MLVTPILVTPNVTVRDGASDSDVTGQGLGRGPEEHSPLAAGIVTVTRASGDAQVAGYLLVWPTQS